MGTKTTSDCKLQITNINLTHRDEDAETIIIQRNILLALKNIRFPRLETHESAYSAERQVEAELESSGACRELQRRAPKAVNVIGDHYEKIPEQQYLTRWSLTYLLGEIRHESSLRILTKILDARIPDEKSEHPEKFSTEQQEVMIRLQAVDGLKKLASEGSIDAVATLLRLVEHSHFSVRRAAAQAYLQCGGPDARQVLKSVLPANEHFVLDLKHGNLHDVLQPRPSTSSEVSENLLPLPIVQIRSF